MAYEFIKTENRDGVLVLTMHDPPTRNALGPEMAAEVRAELDRFEDDPECRVLLVTGTAPSFCSGANVRNFNRSIQGSGKRRRRAGTPALGQDGGQSGWPRQPNRIRRGRAPGAAAYPQAAKALHRRSQRPRHGRGHGRGAGLRHPHCRRRGHLLRSVLAHGPDSRRRLLLAASPAHWNEQYPATPVHWRPHRRQRSLPPGHRQQGCSRRPVDGVGNGSGDSPGSGANPVSLPSSSTWCTAAWT